MQQENLTRQRCTGLLTSGGTTTTWVPLVDASGSTLGLVNAASPQSGVATTYTYDPSGTPSTSGAANEWPFQYQGMEKEFTDPAPYYYSGSGQFYSPQFVRSLTEAGQTGASGTGGPSPNQVPYGPGSQGNGSFGQWYLGQIEPHFGFDPGNLPNIGFGDPEDPYLFPLGAVAKIIEEWASFFEWLFGGSSAPPTPRKLLHGRHPLYPDIDGFTDGEIPDEASAAQSLLNDAGLRDGFPSVQYDGFPSAQDDVLEVGTFAGPKPEKPLPWYNKPYDPFAKPPFEKSKPIPNYHPPRPDPFKQSPHQKCSN